MRSNPQMSRELTLRYWTEFSQSHHNFAWQHRQLSNRFSTISLENCNESERICNKRENVSRGPNGSRTQQLNLHWGVFPALDVTFVMPCNQPAHVPSGIYMGIRLETVVRTNRMLFVLASLFKLIWWGKFTITQKQPAMPRYWIVWYWLERLFPEKSHRLMSWRQMHGMSPALVRVLWILKTKLGWSLQ